jgi:hypothetical protein
VQLPVKMTQYVMCVGSSAAFLFAGCYTILPTRSGNYIVKILYDNVENFIASDEHGNVIPAGSLSISRNRSSSSSSSSSNALL